jgi:hypothetical protein
MPSPAPALQGRTRAEVPAAGGPAPVLAEIFAAAMVLNAFPAVVLAWKSAGTHLPRLGDEQAEESWNEVGHLLHQWSGHADCPGWTFDAASQRFSCACGAVLFETSAMAGSNDA